MCKESDDKLLAGGGEKYFEAQTIMSLTHERGADELIHRSIKELATKEQLPFQSFGMNRAYYYLLVIVHFIFECYKRDITPDVIPVTAYPNTFRRKLIDFAVKITSRSRYIIMNVTSWIIRSICTHFFSLMALYQGSYFYHIPFFGPFRIPEHTHPLVNYFLYDYVKSNSIT